MPRNLCLDTSVFIKYLVSAEYEPDAAALVLEAIEGNARIVVPCFTWAEVGSVLRKKVRAKLINSEQASELFAAFGELPIEYLDSKSLRVRAWTLAEQYQMPTLYDAAFLACAETVGNNCEYWTADKKLLNQLGLALPTYVNELAES